MKIYLTSSGLVAEHDGRFGKLGSAVTIDRVFAEENPLRYLLGEFSAAEAMQRAPEKPFAPIQSQEIWAAGVTYLRSRAARVAESTEAGGALFYDRVYDAARPELFFKATPHRVASPGQSVFIRRDSKWNVPEPELTLAINARGEIFGYTVGNDMSSRDIEAENPLYLPQAKVYDRSAAIGPCILISDTAPPPTTEIKLGIARGGKSVFEGATAIERIRRPFKELAEYLFRANAFPRGCFLMTGTGIVPPDTFTLQPGDEIEISIDGIGTLKNFVEFSA
ncbi:MAG TPA: fumarylacetoacetate hydrolase family protein [Opitutaceae bacterium]|nr:fumarylacetoacetate hydrolase family protein [Opitutaceae bacterium]